MTIDHREAPSLTERRPDNQYLLFVDNVCGDAFTAQIEQKAQENRGTVFWEYTLLGK